MSPPERNDDFSWLVYADWLEDHDRPGADELRDQILAAVSPGRSWHYEYRGGGSGSVGGGVVGGVVGIGSVGSGGGGSGSVGGGVGGVGGVGVGGVGI